jgi:hypothetical protein
VAHRKTTEKGRDTALIGEAKVAVAFDFTPVKRGSSAVGGGQYEEGVLVVRSERKKGRAREGGRHPFKGAQQCHGKWHGGGGGRGAARAPTRRQGVGRGAPVGSSGRRLDRGGGGL